METEEERAKAMEARRNEHKKKVWDWGSLSPCETVGVRDHCSLQAADAAERKRQARAYGKSLTNLRVIERRERLAKQAERELDEKRKKDAREVCGDLCFVGLRIVGI